METDSWWLKLARAEKHLNDLEIEIACYAHDRPYRIEQTTSKGNRGQFSYAIRFTSEPDPRMRLILGDAIHNARSSLDHLAAAMVPSSRRDKASYPILMRDLWAVDEAGEFVIPDDEARASFERAVRGMVPEAVALLLEMQPFRIGVNAPQDALGILSRFENADKHRNLSTLEPGIQDGVAVISARGRYGAQPAPGFRHDTAEIANFNWPDFDPPLTDSEAAVELYGPVVIAVKTIGEGGYTNLAEFREVLRYLREDIVPALEPFTDATS